MDYWRITDEDISKLSNTELDKLQKELLVKKEELKKKMLESIENMKS